MTDAVAALPLVRALLDEARRKDYAHGGVLGVRAKPEWDGPTEFEHDGLPVRVVPCVSALAVREALLERGDGRWLVILTDRDEHELGLSITGHLVGRRLRQPDPWDAVRNRFSATRVDYRLVTAPGARQLATGLLTVTPPSGWPPARGGLLSLDHALGAVASTRLHVGRPGEDVGPEAVLRWSTRAEAASTVADLRALAGDALTEAVLDWLATRCGAAAEPAGALFAAGRPGDVVPLGLVTRAVLATPPGSGPRALLRRDLGVPVTEPVVAAWATESESTTRTLLTEDEDAAARVLARADALLTEMEATATAGASDLLRQGLSARLAELGEALRRCAERAVSRAHALGVESALTDPARLNEVEAARVRVEAHALAAHRDEVRVPRALAAVRLTRWLALPAAIPPPVDLGAHVAAHRDADAWADRAINDAWGGVTDEGLARGLRAVLTAARLRRDAHDKVFAAALATHEETGRAAPPEVVPVEDLLASAVLPLAKQIPVLLVVADGMSAAVATEVVDDVVRRYESWLECLPADSHRRITALAALPSLTHVSRSSLFAGDLTPGDQTVERAGLTRLATTFGVTARLFHKLPLDSSDGGFALAHDVAAAIDDVDGTRLVACVLNTIDDALERADPGGIEWTADTVRHLRPLLDRARLAGRVVVLTSDHGHVIERHEGRLVSVAEASSNRSRPTAGGPPPGDGEVRVTGRRVLLHGGDAVLAVDERLRYGPMRAGYHGGAAAAEVVVPVHVLAPGEAPVGWVLAPPQSPDWWRGPLGTLTTTPSHEPASAIATPTLFDGPALTDDLASAVVASQVFREQRAHATRVSLDDEQVLRLLRALLAAPAHRLDAESAAAALGVATVRLPGALSMVQRLLNVEQYPVLSRDPDGSTVVLDETLLRDQFELNT